MEYLDFFLGGLDARLGRPRLTTGDGTGLEERLSDSRAGLLLVSREEGSVAVSMVI